MIPTDVSDLIRWYKADAGVYSDAGTTPCINDDLVYQWNDQSGNGHAIQATSGNRPTYKTNYKNGMPAISFNGSSSYLDTQYTGEPQTVLMVVKPHVVNAYQSFLCSDTSDAITAAAFYLYTLVGGTLHVSRATTADSDPLISDLALTPDTLVADNWYILKSAYSISGTKTLKAFDQPSNDYYWSDTSSNDLRPITGTLKIAAGYYNNGLGDYLNGYICEILIYNRMLTDAEIAKLDYYLWRRWGFGASSTESPAYIGMFFDATRKTLQPMESSDGINFYDRPHSYTPASGHYVRDPSFYKDSNGVIWVAHTNVSGTEATYNNTFDVCKSLDGAYFEYVASVDCSVASGTGAGARCWDPYFYVDPADSVLHVFFDATEDWDVEDNTIWETHPTNADMTTWSTPVQVTGTAFTSKQILAPTPIKVGSLYYMWFTNRDGNESSTTEIASSSSLLSGYDTLVRSGDWAGWGTSYEGNSILKLEDDSFINYLVQGPGWSTSYYSQQTAGDWTSGSTTWSSKTLLPHTPLIYNANHGMVRSGANEVGGGGSTPINATFNDELNTLFSDTSLSLNRQNGSFSDNLNTNITSDLVTLYRLLSLLPDTLSLNDSAAGLFKYLSSVTDANSYNVLTSTLTRLLLSANDNINNVFAENFVTLTKILTRLLDTNSTNISEGLSALIKYNTTISDNFSTTLSEYVYYSLAEGVITLSYQLSDALTLSELLNIVSIIYTNIQSNLTLSDILSVLAKQNVSINTLSQNFSDDLSFIAPIRLLLACDLSIFVDSATGLSKYLLTVNTDSQSILDNIVALLPKNITFIDELYTIFDENLSSSQGTYQITLTPTDNIRYIEALLHLLRPNSAMVKITSNLCESSYLKYNINLSNLLKTNLYAA